MRTLRLLHVHSGNLYGGVEAILVTLARHSAVEPRLTHTFALCFEGRLSAELTEAGADVRRLGGVRLGRPWTLWRARRRLARLVEKVGADRVVVHSSWSQVIAAPVVRRARREIVLWVHGMAGERSLLGRWARMSPPARLLCVSRAVAESAARAFPRARIAVVYPPIRNPSGEPLIDREAFRLGLGAGTSDLVLLHPGRMEAGKGYRHLIEALGLLGSDMRWLCWVTGGVQRRADASLEEALRRQAAAAGIADRVRFLGHRKDMGLLYRAADLCVHPHVEVEAFGHGIIESLYAGCPVIASDLGGPAEILDESCGVLVPPGSPAALATAMEELARDPERRRAIAAAGPARAAALCDPARQIGAVLEALSA